MIRTEAWVLYQAPPNEKGAGKLTQEDIHFPDIQEDEVLAEPLYGCWETNMTHAINRDPVDICKVRGEDKLILGNAGVVRVIDKGRKVSQVREGDICVLAPFAEMDSYGYIRKIFGYDAPNTIGLLSKRTKLREHQLIPIPLTTKYSLATWATTCVRYATAWDNWKIAFGCWNLQMAGAPPPCVCGWGGGVALAELLLAREYGCSVFMIASKPERLKQIQALGITPVDRREFPDINYDEHLFNTDAAYKRKYQDSERNFLITMKEVTKGERVGIFIDNIGRPVIRATLKALRRQGVVTTAGWLEGGHLSINRIEECINRHIHVYTHGARDSEVVNMVRYVEESSWLIPVTEAIWSWDSIPELADRFSNGTIDSYFPVFSVNPI
jgi:NADPH:quinone reductase-like Zn-dependent oxidoreductase